MLSESSRCRLAPFPAHTSEPAAPGPPAHRAVCPWWQAPGPPSHRGGDLGRPQQGQFQSFPARTLGTWGGRQPAQPAGAPVPTAGSGARSRGICEQPVGVPPLPAAPPQSRMGLGAPGRSSEEISYNISHVALTRETSPGVSHRPTAPCGHTCTGTHTSTPGCTRTWVWPVLSGAS